MKKREKLFDKMKLRIIILSIVILAIIIVIYIYGKVSNSELEVAYNNENNANVVLDSIDEDKTNVKNDENNTVISSEDTWKTENVEITINSETVTKTSAIIVINDKNKSPKSWGMNFAIQLSDENEEWIDLIAKKAATWNEIAMEPDEDGITEMKIDWSNIYGELREGIYRVVKYNGVSTIYSEPFIIE